MEKIIPKGCPYYELDDKDITICYCTIIEDYVLHLTNLCDSELYYACEHFQFVVDQEIGAI